MHRFYLGLAICLSTIAMNYFDELFVNFKEFNLLGKSYTFVSPYTFSDIFWTVIQKFNIVLFSMGSYTMVKGLLTLTPLTSTTKKIRKISLISFSVIGMVYIYQSVSAIIMYIDGFRGDRKWMTTVFLSVVIVGIIVLINMSASYFKKTIQKTKQQEFNDKLETLSLTFNDLTEDLKDIDAISEESNTNDNIIVWKSVTAKKVREMYKNHYAFLKKIENLQD